MTLRVTRQFGEVLGTGDGKARVARQYLEVLAGPPPIYERSATSTLALTQDAYSSLKACSATSTIVLTQAASYDCVWNRSAESTIALAHLATYVGPKWLYANSAILLDHGAYVPEVFEAYASSQITLSQSTSQGGTKRLEAESTIVFAQVADNIIKIRDATSQIVLMHSATVEKILTAHSHINLTQEASIDSISVSAESQLNLTQGARFQPFPQSVMSQLNLTQSVWQNIKSVSASSYIELSQSESVQKPIRASGVSAISEQTWVLDEDTGETNWEDVGLRHSAEVTHIGGQSAANIISFNCVVGLTHVKASGTSVSASSSLSLTHSAVTNETGDAASIINLSQAAEGWAGRPGNSQLALTHEASVTVVQSYTATNTIDLKQAAAYTLIVAGTPYQYSPFVGESTDSDAPTPPPTTLQGPMAGIQVPFQLVYPSTGTVTDSLSLETPNLGNLDRLSFNRVMRETRGGTLVVYADPVWPKVQTLVLSFSNLKSVEAQGLLTFMDDHLGKEIGLIDWEHRYWRGVITSPDGAVVEDAFDTFTASFEFQGELDPTWNPQVVPPSLRYSAIRSEQEMGYYVPNEPQLPTVSEIEYQSAEADSTIKIGYPIYLKANGHLDPAQANAAGPTQVAGLSLSDTTAGFACTYITEGTVERTDWTEVAGSALLVPGNTYFLSPTTAGQITNVAPSTLGQYVVRVGRAVTTTKLDVEIELPILL